MVEATHRLPPRPSYVVITIARQEARKAVKEQLRGQGLKPQYMRVSENQPHRRNLPEGECAGLTGAGMEEVRALPWANAPL
jgi:hypothetical protein